MAASYPTSTKSFTTKLTGDIIQASHVDDLQDEVVAIENDLRGGLPATRGGTGQTSYTTGNLLYASSSTSLTTLAPGASGQALVCSGSTIPQWKSPVWGSFWDTTTQTAASTTTAYAIACDSYDAANYQVTMVTDGSKLTRLTVQNAGVYNIQFSVQLVNTDSTDHDVHVWIRLNGSDVAYSTGQISVPAKHGAVNGHCVTSWNYVLSLAASDYVQFMWHTDNTAVSIEAVAVGSSPTRPAIPSMIITAVQVR